MARPITHCLFDLDGLLLDTEPFYTEASSRVAAEFGKEYTFEMKSKCMGLPALEGGRLLLDLLGGLDGMSVEEFNERRFKIQYELFPTSKPLPGIERLLSLLHKSGVPIAIATSSHKKGFELKTSHLPDLFGLFNGNFVLGDDPAVKKGKPNPDIFLEAARRIGVPPEETACCLVFEDAPNGVRAGLAAGMRVCWIPDPRIDKAAFLDSLSEQEKARVTILSSMEEFQPQAFGLAVLQPAVLKEG
uniref:Uncharacterized protein n=1 Tax=Chromera velia CCMP2878 TaxID=1169474 RepID=A0A0G4HQB6_9ALVE|eukprot:Cvel_7919.t1-p1 / transcript=Cvel_7919.t1 / gene=Cvel_7919 / organism=Chromera_velia_CCMP2878 / gene_product=Pseudouridine-5'-monophosphatase, putative / transcript_product=Pseudouridine-5'-monophosphatase, putative / location=Cvel_scaffold424:73662-75661(+) / protein_length=244 / sequence_SO=supercontig / SO=protein_coding / is_pseudo=false